MRIEDFLSDRQSMVSNPSLLQSNAMLVYSKLIDNDISDVGSTNPFVYALEMSSLNLASYTNELSILNRKQYAIASMDDSDLYRHMYNDDYIGRFSLPSSTKFTMILRKNELITSLVLNNADGNKYMILPTGSTIKVAGNVFTTSYDIIIKQLKHGGLNISYDTSKVDSVHSIETNIIEYNESRLEDDQIYIYFDIDVYQYNINTNTSTITNTSYNTQVAYNDNFYFCRVYMFSNNSWIEINTTHNPDILDINTVTAVIQVDDTFKKVDVYIPPFYVNNSMINSKIRIDVYETKGALNIDLASYGPDDYESTWSPLFEDKINEYTTAISGVGTYSVINTNKTMGGRTKISFSDLRQRVINNSTGSYKLPITSKQLENSVTDSGYAFIKNVDIVTDRIYLASRDIKNPIDNTLVSKASAGVISLALKVSDLQNNSNFNITNNRVCVYPSSLFMQNDNKISIISDIEINRINSLPKQLLIEELNNKKYLKTPFYYIIDYNNNTINNRVYYLSKPSITEKNLIASKNNTDIKINTKNVKITKTNNGYRIVLETLSNEAFKTINDGDVHCQLSYNLDNETKKLSMLGIATNRVATTDEYTFIFDITSSFDINDKHQIQNNKFKYDNTTSDSYIGILQSVDIVYYVTDSSIPYTEDSLLDDSTLKTFLPQHTLAYNKETITIEFGKYLDGLWSRIKAVRNNPEYLRHTIDVPDTYTEDVYDIDPVTKSAFDIVNNQVVYRILHNSGDVKRDSNNNIIYKHRVGDIVLDNDGVPVIDPSRSIDVMYYTDILVMNAIYFYTSTKSNVDYVDEVINDIVYWIVTDLPSFNKNLLEKTKMYFYPKETVNNTLCKVGNNVSVSINPDQRLNITVHVSELTYNNNDVLNLLRRSIINTIDGYFIKSDLYISELENTIKSNNIDEILDIKIDGFNGYNAIKLTDNKVKFNIKKKLAYLSDGSTYLIEDVNIEFIQI